ncbi:glycosyltransferase [Brumimicrobium mesophilum]|uniref:glycosyltransferase n=1 Tax=Brumimicrobium mesophilum TaxID=392717 RepID=UPI000D142EBC|nr:glycosyltransferase [Brumimicrobium mesophilum]
MNKKNILIIASGFYPVQSPRSFRATELAKEFSRQGHKVTIMVPHKENIQPFLNEYKIDYISLGKLTWKIPNLKRLGKIGALFNKGVNRLLPLFFEFPKIEHYFKVKRKLKEEKNNYDLLISIAVPYPIHWGVAAVWKNDKSKNIAPVWLADCGDPYCIQENDTYQPPFYFKWIEKWFMRKVDFITVPTETSYRGYFPEFHSKIKVIPQGFRFEDIDKKATINDGIIRFGYGGSFALNRRDPKELLELLTNLDKSVLFEFHIFTRHSKFVESFAKKDSRIVLHKPTSRIELLNTLSEFQFVVSLANFGTAQTPSKLIDYAIIDKPILEIQTGNLDKDTVLQFLDGNYNNKVQINEPNRYRIENVVTQFLKFS